MKPWDWIKKAVRPKPRNRSVHDSAASINGSSRRSSFNGNTAVSNRSNSFHTARSANNTARSVVSTNNFHNARSVNARSVVSNYNNARSVNNNAQSVMSNFHNARSAVSTNNFHNARSVMSNKSSTARSNTRSVGPRRMNYQPKTIPMIRVPYWSLKGTKQVFARAIAAWEGAQRRVHRILERNSSRMSALEIEEFEQYLVTVSSIVHALWNQKAAWDMAAIRGRPFTLLRNWPLQPLTPARRVANRHFEGNANDQILEHFNAPLQQFANSMGYRMLNTKLRVRSMRGR